MKAVVFDIEGVLIDVSGRLKACLRDVNEEFDLSAESPSELAGEAKRAFWNCFFNRYFEKDIIIEPMLNLAKILSERYVIAIVTGSPESVARRHLKKLKNAGLEPDFIIWRKKGDYRRAPEFKLSAIEKLIEEEELEIAMVFDDNEEVIEAVKDLATVALLVSLKSL